MFSDAATLSIAGVCTVGAVVLSLYQIMQHLRNYTEPLFQRYIIRLIFMVPVYAICSWFSLRWREAAIYYDTLRDCYEAWIIYNFSSLLLAYVGGPGAVVVQAEGKAVHPSWTHLTCCLPTMQVDGFFLRRCKQGTLQFVLLKPVMAALTLLLYAAGDYRDGNMSPRDGYFYISIMYNVCYTLALYGLMLFWIGASELLQPFNPLLKFILVKTVVFLTFWQGIAISMANSWGEISDPEDGKALQNLMICAEMLMAGASMLFAFPYKEYQIGGATAGWRLGAFTHAISIKDVVKDVVHVFAPSYSDYVLYTDGGPADNVKRKQFRGQSASPGGKKRHMQGGLEIGAPPGAEPNSKPPSRVGHRPGQPSDKAFENTRNMAVLLDSDSDGMDSEDDGPQLGTMVASDSDGEQPHSPPRGRGKMPTALLSDSDEDEGPAPTALPPASPPPPEPVVKKVADAAAVGQEQKQQQQTSKAQADSISSRRQTTEVPTAAAAAPAATKAPAAAAAISAPVAKLPAPAGSSNRAVSAVSPPPPPPPAAAAKQGQAPKLGQALLQRQGAGRASSGQEGWADDNAWGQQQQQRGSGGGEGWADENQWDSVKL